VPWLAIAEEPAFSFIDTKTEAAKKCCSAAVLALQACTRCSWSCIAIIMVRLTVFPCTVGRELTQKITEQVLLNAATTGGQQAEVSGLSGRRRRQKLLELSAGTMVCEHKLACFFLIVVFTLVSVFIISRRRNT